MAESAAENSRNYQGENRFLTYYVTTQFIESDERLGGIVINNFILLRKIKMADQGLI